MNRNFTRQPPPQYPALSGLDNVRIGPVKITPPAECALIKWVEAHPYLVVGLAAFVVLAFAPGKCR